MAEPMRIRATMAGDVADVKVLMNHPMETGLRKDAKTGQLVPAHYITEVTSTVNGTQVLNAGLSGGEREGGQRPQGWRQGCRQLD